MLRYVRESYIDGNYIYIFYPDIDENSPGRVIFYANGDRDVLEESKVDVKRYYAGHALSHIDTSKEWGTVAWC